MNDIISIKCFSLILIKASFDIANVILDFIVTLVNIIIVINTIIIVVVVAVIVNEE